MTPSSNFLFSGERVKNHSTTASAQASLHFPARTDNLIQDMFNFKLNQLLFDIRK